MTDAWMVRSSQRNRFLSDLQREIMELEDKYDDRRNVWRKLIEICINFLSGDRTRKDDTNFIENRFFQDFLPAIEEFARADEEVNTMVSELLTWLVQSLTREFHSALMAKEHFDPKTIFRADSATENVLPDGK